MKLKKEKVFSFKGTVGINLQDGMFDAQMYLFSVCLNINYKYRAHCACDEFPCSQKCSSQKYEWVPL